MKKIVIINYGMGNLKSVANAISSLKANPLIASKPEEVYQASHIILPGVGNFAQAVLELKKRNFWNILVNLINQKVYFLGICLGMQLIFSQSEEANGQKGLNLLAGQVKRFPQNISPVPHMGWNQIILNKDNSSMFEGLSGQLYFYFAHSYYCVPEDVSWVAGWTEYQGVKFASAIAKKNIWAVQFHPEKSQSQGLKLLDNFISLGG